MAEGTGEEVGDVLFDFVVGAGVLVALEEATEIGEDEVLLYSENVEVDGHGLVHLDGGILVFNVLLLDYLHEHLVPQVLGCVLHEFDKLLNRLVDLVGLFGVRDPEQQLECLNGLHLISLGEQDQRFTNRCILGSQSLFNILLPPKKGLPLPQCLLEERRILKIDDLVPHLPLDGVGVDQELIIYARGDIQLVPLVMVIFLLVLVIVLVGVGDDLPELVDLLHVPLVHGKSELSLYEGVGVLVHYG